MAILNALVVVVFAAVAITSINGQNGNKCGRSTCRSSEYCNTALFCASCYFKTCSADGDCQACAGYKCRSGECISCSIIGESCSAAFPCCSSNLQCVAGTCTTAIPTCASRGQPCSSTVPCCTTVLTVTGNTVLADTCTDGTCQQFCRIIGESCGSGSSCCSGSTCKPHPFDSSLGTICLNNPAACKGFNQPCTNDPECCAGYSCNGVAGPKQCNYPLLGPLGR